LIFAGGFVLDALVGSGEVFREGGEEGFVFFVAAHGE
jgi:hypothetical protein